jgi:hypothetical protein
LAAFEFDTIVRWGRSPGRKALSRRADERLPFLGQSAEAGPALLLDTCVYIDQMQGRAPQTVSELVRIRLVNHSAIAIAEMMHDVGRLDPKHPGTRNAIARIGTAVRAMPEHRVFAPGADTLGRAALLSGVLCRVRGYDADNRLRALHDSALFMQALRLGLTVLTRNVTDFDFLTQMIPAGRVLFYRQGTPT